MKSTALATLAALCWAGGALAQVPVTQVSGAGIPPGQVDTTSQPSALLIFGLTAVAGDATNGLRPFVDASCNASQFTQCQVDPNLSVQLVPDTTAFAFQVGGPPNCIRFCALGQATGLDTGGIAFVTANDKGNGVLHQTQAGLYRVVFPSGVSIIGSKFGLGGNAPTAAVIETAGSTVLFGNLNNGNVLRFHCAYAADGDPCQSVETVGGVPGAKSRAFAIVGTDLYIATDRGLAVIRNVAGCSNNQGGCGNAQVVNDGVQGMVHSGIATGGVDTLYLAVGASVYRYTISSGERTLVATGFSFCPARTALLFLSGAGDLWFGDDTSCGAQPNTGRIFRAEAADLANLQ